MTGARSLGRGDIAAATALALAVFALLLPAVLLWAPTLYSDGSVESIPRLFAIARAIQGGGLPLWDSSTFAGARPFYVTNESGIFYLPMYPLYMAADLDDIASATVTLALLPYALHLVWAALGGYAFSRMALGLHPAGAFVCGLVYALSPEMWMQIITPDGAYLFALVPWILLALTRFVATARARWWFAGLGFLSLLVSIGTVNFLVRVYFVAGVVAFTLWCMRWRREGLARPGLLAAMAAMAALAVGLNGVTLAGVYESVLWISDAWTITPEMAAGIMRESSMSPLNIVTLFVPDFFGVREAAHGWSVGVTEEMTNVSTLTGGMALAVAATVAWLARREAGSAPEGDAEAWPSAASPAVATREWTTLAAALLVGALVVMMGRFTPVFGWLCAVLPWFFKFPHPIYYRFVECWAVAVLAGIGVSHLVRGVDLLGAGRPGAGAERDGSARSASLATVLCALAAVLAACVALLWPVVWDETTMPGYATLSLFGEWGWFVSRPLLYLAVSTAGLLALFRFAPARARGALLAAVIIVETLGIAGIGLYRGMLFEQKRIPPEMTVEVRDERYLLLDHHPHYELAPELRRIGRDHPVRYTGNVSTLDNQAWAVGARSLLGYSSKPLTPRYRDAIDRFATGMPYDLHWSEPPETFFRNVNVGYLVTYELDLDREPLVRRDNLTLYRLDGELPYVYFQDRVVELERPLQLDRIFDTDLRRAVYVMPGIASVMGAVTTPAGDVQARDAASAAREFLLLNARNRVLSLDMDHPNRLRVEVSVTEPAMLVIAETWHLGWTARVDGRVVPVREVNYFQQGVWVEPGTSEVELSFFPPTMRAGAAISLASLLAVLLVAVATLRVRGRSTRGAS